MHKHIRLVVALTALAAAGACATKKDDNTSADTMTTKGVDTVNGQPMRTTDTVVKTTTTDTIQGKASADSAARRDSIAKADSAKRAKKK